MSLMNIGQLHIFYFKIKHYFLEDLKGEKEVKGDILPCQMAENLLRLEV